MKIKLQNQQEEIYPYWIRVAEYLQDTRGSEIFWSTAKKKVRRDHRKIVARKGIAQKLAEDTVYKTKYLYQDDELTAMVELGIITESGMKAHIEMRDELSTKQLIEFHSKWSRIRTGKNRGLATAINNVRDAKS